jgi:hypothetical protein
LFAACAGLCLLVIPFHFFQWLAAIAPPVWIAGLALDVWSTRSIYTSNPDGFRITEHNLVFKRLIRRFSFWRSVCLFIAGIELPFLAFVSLAIMPAVSDFFLDAVDWIACAATGMVIAGAAHLGAWIHNRRFVARKCADTASDSS